MAQWLGGRSELYLSVGHYRRWHYASDRDSVTDKYLSDRNRYGCFKHWSQSTAMYSRNADANLQQWRQYAHDLSGGREQSHYCRTGYDQQWDFDHASIPCGNIASLCEGRRLVRLLKYGRKQETQGTSGGGTGAAASGAGSFYCGGKPCEFAHNITAGTIRRRPHIAWSACPRPAQHRISS